MHHKTACMLLFGIFIQRQLTPKFKSIKCHVKMDISIYLIVGKMRLFLLSLQFVRFQESRKRVRKKCFENGKNSLIITPAVICCHFSCFGSNTTNSICLDLVTHKQLDQDNANMLNYSNIEHKTNVLNCFQHNRNNRRFIYAFFSHFSHTSRVFVCV